MNLIDNDFINSGQLFDFMNELGNLQQKKQKREAELCTEIRYKKIKQINNLIIKYNDLYQYSIWTPEGICWEDNLTLEQAEDYCRNTTDFLNK